MKKIILLLFVPLALGLLQQASATHIRAVSMYYECLAADTIQIKVVQYQDCGGILPSPGQLVFSGQGPGCLPPSIIGSWNIDYTVDVTPVCLDTSSSCNGGIVSGYVERLFSSDWDFASAGCNQYAASWSLCCRQNATTIGGTADAIVLGGTTIDLGLASCNNAARFLNPPHMWLCSGEDAIFENQAYDPDGDSLAFSLVNCQGANGVLSYNTGSSSTSPMGTGWTVSLNSQTGTLSFAATPGPVEAGYVCLHIAEYRNGVQINSTTMDFKVDVANCQTSNNAAPTIDSLYVIQGAAQTGQYELEVWLGDTLRFGLKADDANPADSLTSRLDTASRIAGAILATNGVNPQFAEIEWLAPGLGRHEIRLFTHDQHCPLPGNAWRTVVINVVAPPAPLIAFYPGDANFDGAVDQSDILALGLAFGATGSNTLAPPFDTSWQAFSRQPWRSSFAFGGNYAYADCDASGQVNGLDADIVDLHFGQSHLMGNYAPVFISGGQVPLSVTVDSDTFAGGDSIEAHVELGTAIQPAAGVYGISFILTYDTALVDSFRISTSFANSWLGGSTNLLTFDKQLVSQGKLAIAITRTDHMPANGHGNIADVIIIVDDVAGKKEEYLDVKLSISDVVLLSANGEQFDNVSVQDEEFVVTRAVTGIPSFQAKPLRIFPQPAGNGPAFVQLTDAGSSALEMTIMDMKGAEVLKSTLQAQNGKLALAGTENLPRGIYLVRLQAGDRLWAGKMVK
ncbi:MAG: T9SS type A sorting domain-containing protein [Bacteroidia bacterium]